MNKFYQCPNGFDTGSGCGDALQSTVSTADCLFIKGYYGNLSGAGTRCPTGTTTVMPFMNMNTGYGDCAARTTYIGSGVMNADFQQISYNVAYVSLENIFNNIMRWANAIAARTVNKNSKYQFDQTCDINSTCYRGTYWEPESWIRNGSFATTWARIDWSGVAVMVGRYGGFVNEFGHSRGAVNIGGNVIYVAQHFSPIYADFSKFGQDYSYHRGNIIFLDTNGDLQRFTVATEAATNPTTGPYRSFIPCPWYSDSAFLLMDILVPLPNTISTFPVPKMGTDTSVYMNHGACGTGSNMWSNCGYQATFYNSTSLNYTYSAYNTNSGAGYNAYPSTPNSVTYHGYWPTGTTKQNYDDWIYKVDPLTLAISGLNKDRVAVAPFNYPPTDTNVPIFMMNNNKGLVLSWTTYESLIKPVPSWDLWYGKQMRGSYFTNDFNGPSAIDERRIVTLITKKPPTACSMYCRGKYNLQQGTRDGDSGSPAFIIVAGRPLTIGNLFMGTYTYLQQIRDKETDTLTLGTRSCIGNSQPCDLIQYSGLNTINGNWARTESGLSSDTSTKGWKIPKAKWMASFCGFQGQTDCFNVKSDNSISYQNK